MQPSPSPRPKLSHVLVPVATVVCMTAIVIAALLSWSVRLADSAALKRQTELVHLVLQQSLDRVAHDQESSTVWDDSVRHLRAPKIDPFLRQHGTRLEAVCR